VALTITPDGVRRPMASAILLLILALGYRLLEKDRLIRAGRWAEKGDYMGTGITGKVLGSVGLGNIAQELGPREGVFNASELCVFFGDVTSAYYLLKMALLAEEKLEARNGAGAEAVREDEEARFYFNKIKTAEHYVFQILPRCLAIANKIQSRNFAALEAVLEA